MNKELKNQLEYIAHMLETQTDDLSAIAQRQKNQTTDLADIAHRQKNQTIDLTAIAKKQENQTVDLSAIAHRQENQTTDLANIAQRQEKQTTDLANIAHRQENQTTDLANIAQRQEKQTTDLAAIAKRQENQAINLTNVAHALETQTDDLAAIAKKQESQITNLADILSKIQARNYLPFELYTDDEQADTEDSICVGSVFERIADIVIARRNAKNKMKAIYEEDKRFIQEAVDPCNALTPEQEKEIHDFWDRYSFAYKNDPEIQRKFSGISGRFDPTYIGYGLQLRYLNRYWNHITITLIRNKNFLDLIFPNAKMPKVIVRNMWARYYTPDRKLITQDQAINLILEELKKDGVDELILKPDDGEEGKGIIFLNKDSDYEEVKQEFLKMKEQFICQRVVKNHPTYATPHPESLNTLRIATLFVKNRVRIVGTVWRMGVDKQIDNWTAGGVSCAVSEDGICADHAVDYFGNRVKVHPSGFRFAGHQLYNCKAVIDEAVKLHYTLPQLRYISWDFAVDEEGDPVLIELNVCGGVGILQVNGYAPYIDKSTLEGILDEHLLRRFYYDRVNWNWDYREYHDHIEIVKYGGRSRKVTVPVKLRGKPVLKIEAAAFAGRDLDEITVPGVVTITGTGVFKQIPDTCKVSVLH